jgi:hypothetical protein
MKSARLVPAISAAFDCESSPREYQSRDAASRISFANSDGDKRNAESAPSGTSKVLSALAASPYAQTGRMTPRDGEVRLVAGARSRRMQLP